MARSGPFLHSTSSTHSKAPFVIPETQSSASSIPVSIIILPKPRSEELLACCDLDSAYKTTHVWQMHFREDGRYLNTTFDRVRLPRPLTLKPPLSLDSLTSEALTPTLPLILARYEHDVVGYLQGTTSLLHPQTWLLSDLVVHPDRRRQGLGKRLVQTGKKLALQQHCHHMKVMLQTKNDPAIQFVQKLGFTYAGYDEMYYNNGDISLIFTSPL